MKLENGKMYLAVLKEGVNTRRHSFLFYSLGPGLWGGLFDFTLVGDKEKRREADYLHTYDFYEMPRNCKVVRLLYE